jgi:N-sulfoglucosamine sulfohydrolase
VPADLPDHDVVRRDLADYLFEVQRFDALVGDALALLDRHGLAADTIVVVTGDHGMPVPRHKGHLYDSGVRVPLAIRWPARVATGRRASDFVTLADLAPTFLAAAGVAAPPVMTGRSLLDVLAAEGQARGAVPRDHVLVGRERHALAQEPPGTGGYPSRAIRTANHLFIRNYAPDRWPAGAPERTTLGPAHADCDDGPTKTFLLERRDEPAVARPFALAFAKRPAEELYDLRDDPAQLVNVAGDPARAAVKTELARRLDEELRHSGDPRASGGGGEFDAAPYHGPRTVSKVQ